MEKIETKDIRKGDSIRVEYPEGNRYHGRVAIEYVALRDGHSVWSTSQSDHYLLDRPEPKFKTYWGMTIADPDNSNNMAVCTGTVDDLFDGMAVDWIVITSHFRGWQDHEWAKRRISEGWVIVENPEKVGSNE